MKVDGNSILGLGDSGSKRSRSRKVQSVLETLEIRVFQGQEREFSLENRIRPEVEFVSGGVARRDEKMNFQ